MKKNTILCCNLKTRLQNDALMKPGKEYRGILKRVLLNGDYYFDNECYEFLETVSPVVERRNPHVFIGKFITITKRTDGGLRLNFRPMMIGPDFNVDSYVIGVARELHQAHDGLFEK